VDAAADLTGQSATLGFLDITFDTGLITLAGELEVTLTDLTGNGRVGLVELAGSVAPLTTVAASGTIDAAADISVAPGVLVVGLTDLSDASIDFEMALTTGSNPFGTLTESSQAKITKLDATFGSPEITINLLNFGNISTNEVLGMLGGVLDAFSALVSSQVMQVPIPFANKTVGDILNYSKSFKEEVLDPLFVSGDFSNPDASGPGGVPDGIVDHHDLHFGSIQTLVARLDDALGLIDLKADYNHLINELSFTIDFNRAFGLGHGNVITITQGVEGTTEEEQQLSFPAATATLTQKVPGNHTVQILTLRNAVKGNYTLALGASTTAPIAFNAAASGTGSVEARLNAALGAAGPVSVTLVSAANGTRVYEITFAADPGQMLVANTEPAGAAKLQGPVEAFRLAFRDDAGNLQVTGVIDATATPAAMEAAIKAQLEALGDIGSDNVTVAHGGIVEHRRLFSITFDDTLGNVAQLGFAGELALNFGQALGDFASISTSGSFGMAAVLDASLTFGLDLSPTTAIEFAPSVFSPEIVSVSTQIEGGGGVNELVEVNIAEPEGASYRLAFRAAEGTGLFQVIEVTFTAATSLADLQAAFIAALGANAPTVSLPDLTNPRLLHVLFNQGDHAGNNVELVSAVAAGILSAAPTFELTLINGAVQILERDGNGQLTGESDVIAERVIGTVVVTVPESAMVGNDSFGDDNDLDPSDDLVNDVRAAVNKALTEANLTLGFFDETSGRLSTGLMTSSTPGQATEAPLDFMANDIAFSVSARPGSGRDHNPGRQRRQRGAEGAGDRLRRILHLVLRRPHHRRHRLRGRRHHRQGGAGEPSRHQHGVGQQVRLHLHGHLPQSGGHQRCRTVRRRLAAQRLAAGRRRARSRRRSVRQWQLGRRQPRCHRGPTRRGAPDQDQRRDRRQRRQR
jgi:hypothetical protein